MTVLVAAAPAIVGNANGSGGTEKVWSRSVGNSWRLEYRKEKDTMALHSTDAPMSQLLA